MLTTLKPWLHTYTIQEQNPTQRTQKSHKTNKEQGNMVLAQETNAMTLVNMVKIRAIKKKIILAIL